MKRALSWAVMIAVVLGVALLPAGAARPAVKAAPIGKAFECVVYVGGFYLPCGELLMPARAV